MPELVGVGISLLLVFLWAAYRLFSGTAMLQFRLNDRLHQLGYTSSITIKRFGTPWWMGTKDELSFHRGGVFYKPWRKQLWLTSDLPLSFWDEEELFKFVLEQFENDTQLNPGQSDPACQDKRD